MFGHFIKNKKKITPPVQIEEEKISTEEFESAMYNIGISIKDVETLSKEDILNKYPTEVSQILHEFEIAAELLIDECKDIISSIDVKVNDKVKRLQSLGFTSTREVVGMVSIIKKQESSAKQIKLVEFYSNNYPLNRFISDEKVKEICAKYSLICESVSLYKGYVPEKSLREIELFNLKDNEINCLFTSDGMVLKNAVNKIIDGLFWHIYKIDDDKSYAFQSADGITFYGKDENNIFGYQSKIEQDYFKINDKTFKICAPFSEINLNSPQTRTMKTDIPYSPVLAPVEGGYLIISILENQRD